MKIPRHFQRRTKIICTIGPATDSTTVLERLIRAGMNIARLNLSHGSQQEHAAIVKRVRRLSRQLGINVAVLMDLPGPKYRTGQLEGGQAVLVKGQQVILSDKAEIGNSEIIPVNLPNLAHDIKAGNTVLLDDGALQLRVISKQGNRIVCRVTAGGTLTPGRGLVVPGMHSSAPFITNTLKEHLAFAVAQQPDYLAISFASSAADVLKVKDMLKTLDSDIPVITKIERIQAVKTCESILAASDGIMVARGDLGVDIPLERVPLVQKEIIRRCNRAGKPVITATQMLESMINAARPTRAEVTDVANAIFDGSDAVMLSAETSVGKHPIAAVKTMARVALETEAILPYEKLLLERNDWLETQTEEMICYSACHIANQLGAAVIAGFTQSGSTARRLSKYRPRAPILAITSRPEVARRLMLYWGVYTAPAPEGIGLAEMFNTAARVAKELHLVKEGSTMLVTGGVPTGITGTTNLLKVETVS